MTDVLDLKKTHKSLYSAPVATPVIVDVPKMNFLMADGMGDPNTSPEFAAAIEALYGVAYTLKFTFKRAPRPLDFVVMPLEGLWWADDMSAFLKGDRKRWKWTLMIMQPDYVSAKDVADAKVLMHDKKPDAPLDLVRLEAFHEGKSAQIMHIGPFLAEGPNIEKVHAFIASSGGKLRGKHHEIYLSDMRRTAPEKLKTIIRQPMG
ncbi:MAG TPA: GyrI-like domain-containing protein [Devosia sp.]|nr:GyrI-like domain-containing protein [Devosia sp.]